MIKQVRMWGEQTILACDERCDKAWGIGVRPQVYHMPDGSWKEMDVIEADALGLNVDDTAWLADDELGIAPADPGTYEGGEGKPSSPEFMNKWCARACERCDRFTLSEPIVLKDFSKRRYNIPGSEPSNGE